MTKQKFHFSAAPPYGGNSKNLKEMPKCRSFGLSLVQVWPKIGLELVARFRQHDPTKSPRSTTQPELLSHVGLDRYVYADDSSIYCLGPTMEEFLFDSILD